MRKIAFALACLPVACESHGHGAQTSVSRAQRPAARAQNPLQEAGALSALGVVSTPRRPKNTFGKLLLKQSHGLVEPKPKETFGKLLLSLNPTTASLVAQSSDPRGRSFTHYPASSSSYPRTSIRQGRTSFQSTARSGSAMGQRSSGAEKRKRSRTPGKRPSDLPPPRADSSFFNDASSKGKTLFGRFNMKVLGTILTVAFGLTFWLVSHRSAKEAQTKAGRIAKKQKTWKHKTNSKGQRPVQRQAPRMATEASTSGPQMTPKSPQEIEVPATSVSESVKVEQTKKSVSRPPAAKKARRKVRRTDDKQNDIDEQADRTQQIEFTGSVNDRQSIHVMKEHVMVQKADGLEADDSSSSATKTQIDMEPEVVQRGRGSADDNGSSCRHEGEGVALSPDSTVASSGESAYEGDSVVAGADEDSDQVRTEYSKNDCSEMMIEQQTTTASSASQQDVDSQQLGSWSPSSSSKHADNCVPEKHHQDEEDLCEHTPPEAIEGASNLFPSCVEGAVAWTPQLDTPEAVQALSKAVEVAVQEDVKCSFEEHDWQHPVQSTSEAQEPELTPELDSNNAILPPGVSLTSGTTFTDGRQVFTPCVSEDGQQWFTDGKNLYTAMYVPVPLDINGAPMPSPSHASDTYQSPYWNSSWDPAWQPHSGW